MAELITPTPRRRHASRPEGGVTRSLNYAIYPTADQAEQLDLFIAGTRAWFNEAVAYKRDLWRAEQRGWSVERRHGSRIGMQYAVKAARAAGVTFPYRGERRP
jgi:hypothetical protein